VNRLELLRRLSDVLCSYLSVIISRSAA